jgi:arylsulfatase A-like enzyme
MWRELLREWVVPPGVAQLLSRWRAPKTQKFWRGQPLPAAPREAAYFAAAHRAALTLTREDDSRSVTALPRGSIVLPVTHGGGDHVQLALSADAWTAEDRVTVKTGTGHVEHSGLIAGKWLDVRLPGSPGTAVTIHTSAPLYCTMPRGVATVASQDRSVRHILVLILDGLTPYLAAPDGHDAPNIGRFFRQGFHATNGWATGEWTLPTTASFFTGVYTSRHAMYHPTRPTRPPERALLAEIVQAQGFHTLGLSTANRLTPAYGTHRGFDRFLYHWPYPGYTTKDYDPARWCDEILGHLDAHRHDRTFVYAQFPDTHPAWNIGPLTRAFNLQRRGNSTGLDLDALRSHPDAGEQGRQVNAIRLRELDRLLGGLFLFIEREIADSTLVVLTSDHGTPWFPLRRNRPTDEPHLVDHRTRVEFLMRGPGVPARTMDSLCSPTIDFMPTLLRAASLPAPADLDGRDLLDPGYRRAAVVSESLYGGVYEIAVRDGQKAYFEKFPMTDDPLAISGPALYRKCFAIDGADYSSPLQGDFATLAALAREHRARMKLDQHD